MPSSKLPPKTIPNPAFDEAIKENEELRDAIEEAILQKHQMLGALETKKGSNPFALIAGMYSEIWSALPDRGGCEIPDEGAWILVKRPPHTDLDERFEVPALSIWRARPVYRRQEFRLGKESGLSRRTNISWPMLLAIINTPGGELYLYPGEYSTIPSERLEVYLEYIGREVQMHFLGAGEPEGLDDQLFYLMCHGISRTEAILLLLPNLKDSDFAWFTVEL